MAAETITQQKFCRHCRQKHDCGEVYRHLGKAQGPSVASKVVVAFLLPIMVFIASLAVFERVLAGVIDTKGLQTALGFLLALSATAICVMTTKAINKRFNKNRTHRI